MIVADASPLIFLARLDLLVELPGVFGDVVLPSEVLAEATADERRPGAPAIHAAVQAGVLRVMEVARRQALPALLEHVDLGEAAAIALAKEIGVVGLLIDDGVGRRVAVAQGLVPIGTLGALVKLHRAGRGRVDEGVLDRLVGMGFRMGAPLRERVAALLSG